MNSTFKEKERQKPHMGFWLSTFGDIVKRHEQESRYSSRHIGIEAEKTPKQTYVH